MTINDINTKLAVLKENKRENVIEFAFALIEWMKIEANTENKPQLVAPQTLKLKDYLATAPQTVQPQLYRLSADGQNIRVRFAVLKKLKKDYIAQLVDNDPGLTTYQASVKGIINVPGRPPYIPSQPYFVHFVTTPDYNKFVLIVNQGEQKRIVTFRNRLTNTQYNKIVQQWQGIGEKSKPEIAELFWKSLDIKEVNREFYRQIKERFDALIGIVKAQHIEATENQAKQFTVRMIGRYIFCWFLKEKGIIPYTLINREAIQSTKNYYQNILLKLFFQTLNTKVADRKPLDNSSFFILHSSFKNIPYLNGGLFDESTEDRLFADLDLDAWLLPFVDVLENYDFTVDESNSRYQQVAVDPEMLGRIFENLLASQNEETEKLANQRKAFGAFYTPREIVDYMVNESIKAYLQTCWTTHIEKEKSQKINNPEPNADLFGKKKPQQLALELKKHELTPEEKARLEKSLESLFAPNPDSGQLKKEEKALLDGFLVQIKILDPACGSGAFPMGVLHKLKELHEILGFYTDPYKLKLDILSNNIYGVDIMPMAVEIARLRSWLSLVLESDYRSNLPANNFGIDALPNLDFKFVCANSLIDLGLEAFIASSSTSLLFGFNEVLIGRLRELEQVRKDFFRPEISHGEKDKLQRQYLAKRDLIVTEIEAESEPVLHDIAAKLRQWNPFDDSSPSPFFSPSWMFGIENGFDVVIGNPPYVQMQKNNGHLANQLKDAGYSTYERMGDVYAIFYELGFKLLQKKGIHTFITSSQWLKAGYGKSLRKLFLTKNPLKLIALGPGIFESAVVDTNILIAKNESNNNKLEGSTVDKPEQLNHLNDLKYQTMPYVTIEKWAILNDGNQSINEKIKAKGKPLVEWGIQINFGIKTGYNEAFIIDESKRNELVKADAKNKEIIKPILKGREINKYISNWENDYIVFVPWHFPLQDDNKIVGASDRAEKEFSKKFRALYDYLESHKEGLSKRNQDETGIRYEWYALQRSAATYRDEFSKEKIIWKRIGSQLRFSYSDSEIFCLDSTCIATGEKIKYLTALLNSKLCNYQLFESAPKTGMGDLIISVQALEPLLMYYPIESEQKQIETLVDKIISLKKQNQPTTTLEREIDVMVYKLYDLSYEEVRIIDPDFWMDEGEYAGVKVE
ncbi:MAG: N-6 DNA methylase [Bacteroidetes bacterium]|nr:N-6 DNA methylase [Bacteroidota bacterium]